MHLISSYVNYCFVLTMVQVLLVKSTEESERCVQTNGRVMLMTLMMTRRWR